MALQRTRGVSLMRPSTAMKDPETLLRFKQALDEAKRKGLASTASGTATERNRLGIRTNPQAGPTIGGNRSARALTTGKQTTPEIDRLQELYNRMLWNENNDMSNPPSNRQYRMRKPTNPQQMFLGGFFKKAGRFAKSALPLVGMIPGVGTAIGAAAMIAGELLPGEKPKKTSSAGDGLSKVGDLGRPATIPITAQASMGADFAKGGVLPKGSNNLKEFVMGGKAKKIGGTALEFTGPDHAGGGIDLPGVDAEVEGGETLDLIIGKGGKAKSRGVPFVFSNRLKVPGSNVSFADTHKRMPKENKDGIRQLAHDQELIAGRLRGTNPEREMFLGGLIKAGAGFLSKAAPFIPGIANIAQGMFGKTESAQYGPIDRSSIRTMMAERDRIARQNNEVKFNSQAALNENRRSAAGLLANRNVSDAVKAAATAGVAQRGASIVEGDRNKEIEANMNVRAEKNRNLLNASAGIAGEQGRLGMAQSQADFANQQEKLAAKAAKRNLLNTGISQIGNIFASRAQDKYNRESDNQAAAIIGAGAEPAAWDRIAEFLGLPKSTPPPKPFTNTRLSYNPPPGVLPGFTRPQVVDPSTYPGFTGLRGMRIPFKTMPKN